MSEKTNVLVFSGATYPAMQIIDCLKSCVRYHVIAAASYPNHSEYVCDDTVTNLPFINDPAFLQTFIKLLKKRNVSLVIPTDETIAMVLKEHDAEIPATIVCSPYETTKLCRYKDLMYEVINGEVYCPIIYKNISEVDSYPVFIKPISSQGSKGATLIKSAEELEKVDNLDTYVVSEYLPGEEFTIDCFTNKNRELVFCNPRIRTRLMNGITARGHNVPLTDEFKTVMEGLNSKVEFRGYWYAQLRRAENGQLKLLEICTRFAGSFAISKGKGINLPLLALSDFSDLAADVVCNDYEVECDKTYIDRYRLKLNYENVYVDYDDTITKNSGHGINPYVIAYLYQCKNKKKKIYLITRHKDTFNESLDESFSKLGISKDLFDEIIQLTWNQKKSDAIVKTDNSIFIDNSFAERKLVHDTLGIPVFDVCNVDSLFDWRE